MEGDGCGRTGRAQKAVKPRLRHAAGLALLLLVAPAAAQDAAPESAAPAAESAPAKPKARPKPRPKPAPSKGASEGSRKTGLGEASGGKAETDRPDLSTLDLSKPNAGKAGIDKTGADRAGAEKTEAGRDAGRAEAGGGAGQGATPQSGKPDHRTGGKAPAAASGSDVRREGEPASKAKSEISKSEPFKAETSKPETSKSGNAPEAGTPFAPPPEPAPQPAAPVPPPASVQGAVVACDPGQAILYDEPNGFTFWVTRSGTVTINNPLRPLTPDVTRVLQLVIAGKLATAYGPDLTRLRRGGAPGALEGLLGGPIRWDAALGTLPDGFDIVNDAGAPLALMRFKECGTAPAVKAPTPVAGKEPRSKGRKTGTTTPQPPVGEAPPASMGSAGNAPGGRPTQAGAAPARRFNMPQGAIQE